MLREAWSEFMPNLPVVGGLPTNPFNNLSVASRDVDRAPSAFAARVLREFQRRDFAQAERRIVLGDGAAWIWNFADEHLPGAIQIVDLFHAKQHLFDAAKALYGPDSDLAAQWGKARRYTLDRLGPAPVIDALRINKNQ